ncbi:MAG: SpoIIE family protein phosphatase [Gemmatimonadetes bacterium]|nr:SpoIIE family protein phosphatase [Gemmatimonadota bacterium]MDE2736838.1 SpoIIE family protein phosphatase [Gemmatimonadota bacterium]
MAILRPKILVVDDEPDLEHLVRQRMRREIRSGQYSFMFAQNGVEALEVLSEEQDIDMVLSDINMPRMDGLTLLEQIPKVDPNIRSVIVSAYGDMKNIRTAMNRGAFDFITKPIDFEDMKVTIQRTLRHLELWREALESRDKLVALQNELSVANKMQQSILPTSFPTGSGFEIFGSMKPARDVGGDFFDVLSLEDGRIGLVVADVSDKGVPAALFMMSSRTLLKGSAIGLDSPGKVLSEVNQLLQEENDAAMFVTVFYATFDPETGELAYANGGHNTPLVVHADGSSTVIPPTGGVALGVVPGFPYEESSMTLQPGDRVVLYTDGVTEAENDQGDQFELERLCEIFTDGTPMDAHATNEAVFAAVEAFAGDAPQFDDVTCLTLRRSETDQ